MFAKLKAKREEEARAAALAADPSSLRGVSPATSPRGSPKRPGTVDPATSPDPRQGPRDVGALARPTSVPIAALAGSASDVDASPEQHQTATPLTPAGADVTSPSHPAAADVAAPPPEPPLDTAVEAKIQPDAFAATLPRPTSALTPPEELGPAAAVAAVSVPQISVTQAPGAGDDGPAQEPLENLATEKPSQSETFRNDASTEASADADSDVGTMEVADAPTVQAGAALTGGLTSHGVAHASEDSSHDDQTTAAGAMSARSQEHPDAQDPEANAPMVGTATTTATQPNNVASHDVALPETTTASDPAVITDIAADDLMAELEAELSAPDGLSAGATSSSEGPVRKNPFADPVQVIASTYHSEVVAGPIPTGSVSVAEYDRLQEDLDAVRQQRDELQVKNAALDKQVDALQQQQKSGRGLLGRFRKDKPEKEKPDGSKADKAGASVLSAEAAEIAVLREKVSQLKAEIVLHKETKDQLATELRSAMSDFDDQRATIGSTIATLTAENASLKARLAKQKMDAGESAEDSGDENDRISVDAAEASLRVELHRQVQYLETKCARAESEARDHARERELLKAELGKVEALMATLTAENATLKKDNIRLNDELSGLISEGHTASTRLRLAEEEAAKLRARIAESDTALEAEIERTSQTVDRALDAEGTLNLVRKDLEAARKALAQAEVDRAKALAESSSALEGLTTANTALTLKLSEHEAAQSAKEDRLSALASRLARGDADRNTIAGGGTPSPSASPTEGGTVSPSQRALSGPLGLIESRMLAAVRERDAMSQRLSQQLEERKHFDDRLAEVQSRLDEAIAARDAIVQENRIVVDGNTKMSGALAATESALERERVRAAAAETKQGSLEAKIAVADHLAEESARSVEELKAQVTQLTAEKDELERQVAETTHVHREASATAERELSELTSRISILETEASTSAEEVLRLKKALTDAEAQRTLDKKVSTKMIKDLSKQLQKKKPAQRVNGSSSPNPTRRTVATAASGHRRTASAGLAAASGVNGDSLETSSVNSVESEPCGSPRPQQQTLTETPTSSPPRQAKLEPRRSSDPATHTNLGETTARRGGGVGGSALAGCTSCRKLTRKIDFYESHVKDLTEDVKNKAKIIQSYLLREKRGQLLPPKKAPPPSSNMLLSFTRNPSSELTAEANQKLQQVTEDTLLQNIHLRESLDVMSAQIAELQSK